MHTFISLCHEVHRVTLSVCQNYCEDENGDRKSMYATLKEGQVIKYIYYNGDGEDGSYVFGIRILLCHHNVSEWT